jgi:acyl-CoA thioesterase I
MNYIVYFFGSGNAFFVGIGFILAGLAISIYFERRWLMIVGYLAAEFGLLLVVLSAAPIPYWLYIFACAMTLAWLVADRRKLIGFKSYINWIRGLVVIVWAVCFALEIPFRFVPVLSGGGHPAFGIIGDSVTAGLGEPDKNTMTKRDTWPGLLVQKHDIEVTDLSQMGATTASALKQVDKLPAGSGLVLLEIGGNDLLGPTSTNKFESDLDVLLKRVCTPGRSVMMFELPLPPFRNGYGLVQRRLAARYQVLLIPKRVFIAVLSTPGATFDGIHLTPAGHEQMAMVVWSLIKPVYGG